MLASSALCATAAFLLGALQTPETLVQADDDRLVQAILINAPIEEVWEAWTTTEGILKWMVPNGTVDFKLGGTYTTTYDPSGDLEGEEVIVNSILAFDPHRMIAMKTTRTPASFPFKEAMANTWSVVYFEDAGIDKVIVRIHGLGYGDDEQSRQMKEFFNQGNQMLLETLKRVLEADNRL